MLDKTSDANSKPAKLTVVSARNDGLGCRLMTLINVIAIADHIGANFKFGWRPHKTFDRELQPLLPAESVFGQEFRNAHLVPGINRKDYAVVNGATVRKELIDRVSANPLKKGILVGEFAKDDGPVSLTGFKSALSKQSFVAAFEKIEFSEAIKALKTAATDLVPKEAVAVHARRGDIVYGDNRIPLWNDKYSPLALLEVIIGHLHESGAPVIFFSDDRSTIDVIRGTPGVIILDDLRPAIVGSAHDAVFFDLFAMMRCQTIISTKSGFSITASLGGGATIHNILEYFGELAAAQAITAHVASFPGKYSRLHTVKERQYVATHLRKVTPPTERVRLLREVSEEDSENPTFPQLLALELLRLGRADEAEMIFARAADKHLESGEQTSGSLASRFSGLREPDAYAQLRRNANEDRPFIAAHASRWLLSRGRPIEAVRYAEMAAAKNLDNVPIALQKARALLASSRRQEGLDLLKQLSADHPELPIVQKAFAAAVSTRTKDVTEDGEHGETEASPA